MFIFYLLLIFLPCLFLSFVLLGISLILSIYLTVLLFLSVIPFPSHSAYLLIHSHSLSLIHIINSISTFRPPSLPSSTTLIFIPGCVYVFVFQWFYFWTASTLPPATGLPVCTAALHTDDFTTILQCGFTVNILSLNVASLNILFVKCDSLWHSSLYLFSHCALLLRPDCLFIMWTKN